MIRMNAPKGTSAVTVGGQSIEVKNGVVDVDPTTAALLRDSFGFTDSGDQPQPEKTDTDAVDKTGGDKSGKDAQAEQKAVDAQKAAEGQKA